MKLTPKEELELIKLADKCDVNIDGITFTRKKMWFAKAFWSWASFNRVYISMNDSVWDALDEIAHELIHREQCKRDGIIKYTLIKTLLRLYSLFGGTNWYEEEAYARQRRVDTLKREIK